MIREIALKDLAAVNVIYNQAVNASFQTADTKPISDLDRLQWLEAHQLDNFPIYVLEIDGKVIGWISLSAYRKGRNALRYNAEVSYYIHQDFQQQGYGSQLLTFIIKKAKALNFKTLFAILLDRNTASIKLLEKIGFEKWGVLPNVADFDGMECSHLYYGLRIKE